MLEWVAAQALPSGVLPEQVHPETGEFLSVSPLTWSHGSLVATMLDYAEKAAVLDRGNTQSVRAIGRGR